MSIESLISRDAKRFTRLLAYISATVACVAGTSTVKAGDALGSPGGKGAQMYCFMRSAGNSHDVSWTAAYALIKRQSASLFKTSPEHAAVMITEAVVQNPGTYPDCGRYLGSLFEKAAARDSAAPVPTDSSATDNGKAGAGSNGTDRPASGSSRYSY